MRQKQPDRRNKKTDWSKCSNRFFVTAQQNWREQNPNNIDNYIEHIKSIFEPYNTEYYYVELVAPQSVRLERNGSENRLKNKPSKQNLEWSNKRLLEDDSNYRIESLDGEIPFDNYIKIDNTNLSAKETAKMIKERFEL